MSRKLDIEPYIHETADISDSSFGRYTEVSERCRISEATFGDYSYIMQDGSVWCATIGKFVNIAAAVRINATNHPTWRATLHHFTYRPPTTGRTATWRRISSPGGAQTA